MKWYHVGIRAKDREASVRFYQNVLGLAVVDNVEILGKIFTFVGNDTIQIEIEEARPGDVQADPSAMTGLNHICVVVDDIRKLLCKAKDQGAEVLMDPFQPRPDRFTTFLRDPDGVLIQVIQYVEG
jgi:catechol 2,3-dioxygenase-like lactoylglutathione lyase family enzyme